MFLKREIIRKDPETCDVKQGRQAIRGCIAVVMCLFTTVIQILFDQSAITLQGSENLMLLCSFNLLPSMLLVGICGIIPSMLSFVAVFIDY